MTGGHSEEDYKAAEKDASDCYNRALSVCNEVYPCKFDHLGLYPTIEFERNGAKHTEYSIEGFLRSVRGDYD